MINPCKFNIYLITAADRDTSYMRIGKNLAMASESMCYYYYSLGIH